MRKFVIAGAVAAAALTLSACSEGTEDAATETVDAAAADMEANADAAVDTMEEGAADAADTMEAAGDEAAATMEGEEAPAAE